MVFTFFARKEGQGLVEYALILTERNPPQAAALQCQQIGGFLRGFSQCQNT